MYSCISCIGNHNRSSTSDCLAKTSLFMYIKFSIFYVQVIQNYPKLLSFCIVLCAHSNFCNICNQLLDLEVVFGDYAQRGSLHFYMEKFQKYFTEF